MLGIERMRTAQQTFSQLSFLLIFGCTAFAEEAPSAVGRISYGDSPTPEAAICSGVLVAPDLVLTAGHCVRTCRRS